MSDKNVKAIEIESGALIYLSPLTVVAIEKVKKQGKWGVYSSSYSLTARTQEGTTVQCEARRNEDWLNQLMAIKVKNPILKTFSFTKNSNGEIIVNGVS